VPYCGVPVDDEEQGVRPPPGDDRGAYFPVAPARGHYRAAAEQAPGDDAAGPARVVATRAEPEAAHPDEVATAALGNRPCEGCAGPMSASVLRCPHCGVAQKRHRPSFAMVAQRAGDSGVPAEPGEGDLAVALLALRHDRGVAFAAELALVVLALPALILASALLFFWWLSTMKRLSRGLHATPPPPGVVRAVVLGGGVGAVFWIVLKVLREPALALPIVLVQAVAIILRELLRRRATS
jgi:hypothetical protein